MSSPNHTPTNCTPALWSALRFWVNGRISVFNRGCRCSPTMAPLWINQDPMPKPNSQAAILHGRPSGVWCGRRVDTPAAAPAIRSGGGRPPPGAAAAVRHGRGAGGGMRFKWSTATGFSQTSWKPRKTSHQQWSSLHPRPLNESFQHLAEHASRLKAYPSYFDRNNDLKAYPSYFGKALKAYPSYFDKDSKAYPRCCDRNEYLKAYPSYCDEDLKASPRYVDREWKAYPSYVGEALKAYPNCLDRQMI